MGQLDLFPIDLAPCDAPDDLFLVAHKCRGTMVVEIAMRWYFSTPSDPGPWWILQTTGNRIYPYWIGAKLSLKGIPTPPPDSRDFYQAHLTTSKPPKRELTIDDLL